MNNIQKLPPFKRMCMSLGTIPTSYLESLTYAETLIWLCKYLEKEVIPALNNNAEVVKELEIYLNQLKSYVDNYFNNLDVQEEINNKLDEMAKDGKLSEIINQEIFKELNEKISNAMLKTDNQNYNYLTLKRKLRKFIRNINHPEHVSGQDYAVLQGGTYTGNDKMVISNNRENNDNLLQEISLIDGSVIRQTKMQLGHANSITYNPNTNKLYITGLQGDDKHKVYIVDYLTFTYESTLIFDSLENNEGTHSISYDIVKDKYYLITETTPTNYLRLYELNIITQELNQILLNDYDNTISTTNTNDCLVYNDIIYILKFSPMLLVTYDLNKKTILNVYNIKNTIDRGTPVGELENISIKYDQDNKNLILGSSRPECHNGWYNMYQFYEANTVHNISEIIPINRYGNDFEIYVDINSNSTNPNGTSSNPYKHISEAIEICSNYQGSYSIRLVEGTYPYFYVNGLLGSVSINGNNSIINGLYINRSRKLYIYEATINNTSSLQAYDIVINYSDVRLGSIILSENDSENIHIHNTKLELFNCQNFIFYSQSENEIINYDNTSQFKVKSGKMPTLSKPVKLFNGNFSNQSQSITYDLSDNLILLNAPNLLIKSHGNYGYFDNFITNITKDGTRIFSTLLNNWYVILVLTRSGNSLSINVSKSYSLKTNEIVDNTSTATGDFTIYATN